MKTLKKSLSVFLAAVMLFTTFSVAMPVFAAEADKETEAAPSEEAVVSNPEILYEITDDRTANTKSFMQSDGTKLIVQYKDNIHYKSPEGEFVEYDNSLSETESDENQKEYKTNASDIDIRISKKTNGKKLVRITKDKDTLSWSFADISKVTGKVSEKTLDDDATSLENFASEVTFSDAFEKTDLQYIIYGDSVKENIILNGKDAPKEFRIEYKYSGLTPLLSADKKTITLNNSDNETVFVITAPFMTDSNGEENTDLYYELGEIKNDQFTATLICDNEWLNAENRSYPVTVDPVIFTEQTWTENNYQSAYISSYKATSCFGRGGANYEGSLYAGYEYASSSGRREKVRGLIKFSLPSLKRGYRVVKAEMHTYFVDSGNDTTVNIKRVTGSWNQSSVTWNTQPSTSSLITEYKTFNLSDSSGFKSWNITTLVNDWYMGTYTNNGIMMISPAENDGTHHRARFYSSGYR